MKTRDIANCRCMLFTPATRPERFHKSVDVRADGIVIDLEDSVPLPQKDAAREQTISLLKEKGRVEAGFPFVTAIRVNNIHTLAGLKDLAAIAESGIHPDAIVLPKVEGPAEVEIAAQNLQGDQKDIGFITLVETARGLQFADAIAGANDRVKAISFGGADLAADLGATLSWEPMLFARSRVVQAAATAGIIALDVPYLDLHNTAGLQEECERVRSLGYAGKFAIHPAHVATVMATFTPDAASVEQARKIVAAYEGAQGAACEVDGKMVDVPVYRSARRIVSLSDNT